MFKQFLFILLLFALTVPVFAQTEDPAMAELLENFFRDNEQATESDAQQLLEYLENLRTHPLNLNQATREDLASLGGLLNDLQIENLLTYRTKFGRLLNNYELQSIPGWQVSDIRKVLQFAQVNSSLDTRNTSIFKGFTEGENELLLRWGHPVPANYVGNAEGTPNSYALRYRHSFDNRLRMGFTAENDAGEGFFSGSNKQGFDFYSAHIFVQNLNENVRTVALGDYSVRFGQGLLLQTGFSPGKSAETSSITRGGRKLNAYRAFGETFFFRGAAATIGVGRHWEVTALYSNRLRDGNILIADSTDLEAPEIAFSALQTSGYHRLPSEIADEKSLREQAAALSVTYSWRTGQITANGLHLQYDKPLTPTFAPYRQFAFQGQALNGASVDYNFRRRNWFFFGETARSDNGAIASVNGLLLSPDQHVTLSALHRSLPRDYQSVYAAPFAEVSGASNEVGTYLGADIRFIRRVQINVYADVWRHPWLRFGVDAPSRGREFLARAVWTKSRNFSMYALWQSEVKERNSDVEGYFGLLENRRDRFRLHLINKINRAVELRSRVEWTTFQVEKLARTNGFIMYQEMVVKPLGFPVSGTVRYALFDTDNFDTRVFAYENDLFSAISIPGFAGRGSRYYLNLTWRVNKWLRLETRVEQTNQRRAVTTTGTSGKEMFWKVQARVRW